MNAYILVAVAAVAGPEFDARVAGYEDGSRDFNKDEVLRDLKAAVNLASMLSIELEKTLV